MAIQEKKWLVRLAWGAAILALAAVAGWQFFQGRNEDGNLASGNGRIEATEIDVAAKIAGRIRDIFVKEGDFVTAGQVLAQMDTDVLQAQLREAEAQLRKARVDIDVARSRLTQRESEKAAAEALVVQRQAEFTAARKRSQRTAILVRDGAASQQEADDDRARMQSFQAAVTAARAQVAAAEAAIVTARSEVLGVQSAAEGAQATIEKIQADIADSDLKSPRDGRVQYLVAQPGEVVGAGGRVLNLVDLTDVYMTFFLPTFQAGRLGMGSEVRLVLDAAPEYVIPAHVSFLADVAQFTPKTVETASEREKLMIRVKAQIPADLLRSYIVHVKTGLPGVAYVRVDSSLPWPPHLQLKKLK